MSEGFFQVARELLTEDLWLAEDFNRAQALIDLIGCASWRRRYVLVRGIRVDLERGQLVGSLGYLAQRWGWSRTRVRKYLKMLEDMGYIKTQKNNVTTVITVTCIVGGAKKDTQNGTQISTQTDTQTDTQISPQISPQSGPQSGSQKNTLEESNKSNNIPPIVPPQEQGAGNSREVCCSALAEEAASVFLGEMSKGSGLQYTAGDKRRYGRCIDHLVGKRGARLADVVEVLKFAARNRGVQGVPSIGRDWDVVNKYDSLLDAMRRLNVPLRRKQQQERVKSVGERKREREERERKREEEMGECERLSEVLDFDEFLRFLEGEGNDIVVKLVARNRQVTPMVLGAAKRFEQLSSSEVVS